MLCLILNLNNDICYYCRQSKEIFILIFMCQLKQPTKVYLKYTGLLANVQKKFSFFKGDYSRLCTRIKYDFCIWCVQYINKSSLNDTSSNWVILNANLFKEGRFHFIFKKGKFHFIFKEGIFHFIFFIRFLFINGSRKFDKLFWSIEEIYHFFIFQKFNWQ